MTRVWALCLVVSLSVTNAFGETWGSARHEGAFAISVGRDGTTTSVGPKGLRRWSQRGELLGTVPMALSAPAPRALSPDGSLLAVAKPPGPDGQFRIVLIELPSGHERRVLGSPEPIYGLQTDPTSQWLIARTPSTSQGTNVRAWNLASGLPEKSFRGVTFSSVPLSFSADGKRVAAADNTSVSVRDVEGRTVKSQPLRRESVSIHGRATEVGSTVATVRLSADGRRLAVAYGGGHIDVYDVDSSRVVTLQGCRATGNIPLAFMNGGKALATCAEEGGVRVYDIATSTILGHWERTPTVAIEVMPDDRRLVLLNESGGIEVHEIAPSPAK